MSVNVAIVGATGAVGSEFLTVLAERKFPIKNLKLLASARSAGKKAEFAGKTYSIEELTHDSFKDVQIAFFSAGGSISKEFAPSAVKAGAVVIDNTSAFRMREGIPLVVPEVNADAVAGTLTPDCSVERSRSVFSIRALAAIRYCSSTSSGSTHIRPCTS